MSLDALRARLRSDAEQAVAAAAAALVAELAEAGPESLQPGSFRTTILPSDNAVDLAVSLAASLEATTVWRWTTGSPSFPFEPHHAADLDGAEFTPDNWMEVLGKDPADVPVGSAYYYPGDHDGCQCTVETILGTMVFDPAALAAQPFTVEAFGQTILITPPAPGQITEGVPEWWAAIMDAENWRRLLTDAYASLGGR